MFRMNKLSAAIVAAGLLSGSFLAGPQLASAQAVSTTGSGTAAVVPYYTVRAGWQTLVNVTNTTSSSLAVKVRIRESYNSRDILDFNILLSPYDVWTAWLSLGADGKPFLQTNDRSCTVPISVRDSGASGSELAYTGVFKDLGPQTTDRMLEGYAEFLVMGEAPTIVAGTAPYYAEHVNGEPRNCVLAEGKFVNTSGTWDGAGAIPGTAGSGDPVARSEYGVITSPTPLKVNISYIKRDKGLAGGGTAVHLAGWGVGQNLVTAQQYPWFLEPTLPSHAGLWSTSALPTVEAGFNATAVLNEWSNNPKLGVATDWVVAFPTKSYHVDVAPTNIQAGCNNWRTAAGGGAVGACTVPLTPFENLFTDKSNITVTYNLFNREEIPLVIKTDGVTVSPAPPPEVKISTLPYETNVLVIGNSAYGDLVSAFDSTVTQVVDIKGQFNGSEPEFGWVDLAFSGAPAAGVGLPAAGMIFKARDFGDPTLNFGQVMDHGYLRPAAP
ncbi:MAG TPA: hypothetical protein P5260_06025 [Candidatus Competibacter sp.]|nr:hypothetical protein [Candidatus Competibacter sp.]